jgi:hypothetical protein
MEQKTPASKVNTEAGGRAVINMADHTKAPAEIGITTCTITPQPTARVPGSRADIEEVLNNFLQTRRQLCGMKDDETDGATA